MCTLRDDVVVAVSKLTKECNEKTFGFTRSHQPVPLAMSLQFGLEPSPMADDVRNTAIEFRGPRESCDIVSQRWVHQLKQYFDIARQSQWSMITILEY